MSKSEQVKSKENYENSPQQIVIDEQKGLVFSSEEELYQHFSNEIEFFEKEFFSLRDSKKDISEEKFSDFENQLGQTLEDPDEIWEDKDTLKDKPIKIYLKEFHTKEKEKSDDNYLFHVAICYMTDQIPSFVYLHFPSTDIDLVEKYCRGELVYDRTYSNAPLGAIEGDALGEGDSFSKGLYDAMLKLRGEKDILEAQFQEKSHLRESTVEEADEIWRSADSTGNVLVNFIKEFPDEQSGDLWYIVVTIEDSPSGSHALLFSFPTNDKSLVDRYRHGENLQAEEVVQESSH